MNPPFSACMYFTNLDPICGSGFVFCVSGHFQRRGRGKSFEKQGFVEMTKF